MPSIAVILPAAGRSARFGRDKLGAMLMGESVFSRSARAFIARLGNDVACVVIVHSPGAAVSDCMPADVLEQFTNGVSLGTNADKRILFVDGGDSRAASVLNGIRAVPDSIDFVAVHDAARPLVSQELIDRTFAHAFKHGSAIPALAVKLTIKQSTGPLPARVEKTLPRTSLWEMQTPQVLRRDALLTAYDSCKVPLEQITDDAQVLELAGRNVWLVPGDESNLKITTPQDLLLAEQLLRMRDDKSAAH